MSDASDFLHRPRKRRRKKRENEDIRKYVSALGKVHSTLPKDKSGSEWKSGERRRKGSVNQCTWQLGREETTTPARVPAIALSNGLRKKQLTVGSDYNEMAEDVENIPSNEKPSTSLPTDCCRHSNSWHTSISEDPTCSHSSSLNVVASVSPAVTDQPCCATDQTPLPSQSVVESDHPSSWDSIIDGSLPSQLYDKHISETSLLAVVDCDTQQLLAQLQ